MRSRIDTCIKKWNESIVRCYLFSYFCKGQSLKLVFMIYMLLDIVAIVFSSTMELRNFGFARNTNNEHRKNLFMFRFLIIV